MPRIAEYSLKASTQYTTTHTLDKWKFVCQEEEVSASVEVTYLKLNTTVLYVHIPFYHLSGLTGSSTKDKARAGAIGALAFHRSTTRRISTVTRTSLGS